MPNTGELVMPPGIGALIGFSDDTMDAQALRPEHRNHFLVSFEPLIDKYGVLSRAATCFYNQSRDRAPLGHHQRGVALPLAVTPKGRSTSRRRRRRLLVDARDGNAKAALASWCAARAPPMPSITLETALGLIPEWMPIKMLKIDAQGADFMIVEAADKRLVHNRVEAVQMEVRSPQCPPLYKGQIMCDRIMRYMSRIGYEPRDSPCPPGLRREDGAPCGRPNRISCCEQNTVYVRVPVLENADAP